MSNSNLGNNDKQVKGHTLKKYHRQCLDLMAHDPVIWWDIQFPVSHHAVVELEQRGLVERNDSGNRARLTEDGKLVAAEIYQQTDKDLYDNPVSGRKLTPSEREQIEAVRMAVHDVFDALNSITGAADHLKRKAEYLGCHGMVSLKGKSQIYNVPHHVHLISEIAKKLSKRTDHQMSELGHSILDILNTVDETIE